MYRIFWCFLVLYVVLTGSIVRSTERMDNEENFCERIFNNSEEMRELTETLSTMLQKQHEELPRFGGDRTSSQTETANVITSSAHAPDGKILHKLLLKLTELSKQQRDIALRANRAGMELELMARMQFGSFLSCKDIPVNVSGIYNIRANDIHPAFRAFCEQDKHEGGWMVIHHRYDGSLDMDRNWNEYKNGFGKAGEEVWIGLERIHQMTNAQESELLVEMIDFKGQYKFARYDSFAIGSESEGYILKVLGNHNGTAGDSLSEHVGMKFSTKDRRNDRSHHPCARSWLGGWWYHNCYSAHLNGPYLDNDQGVNSKMEWYKFNNGWTGLSYARMMIRPLI